MKITDTDVELYPSLFCVKYSKLLISDIAATDFCTICFILKLQHEDMTKNI